MTSVRTINRGISKIPSWPLYLLLVFPGGYLFYLGLIDALGPDPIHALLIQYGEFGLQMLIVTLLISPIQRWTGVRLIKFRRATGLLAFYYIFAHMLVFMVLDYGLDMNKIIETIIMQPFITFGMLGFTAMVPLAITSNNLAIRKIGGVVWNKIHRLVYLAAAAGAVHYLLVVKGWPIEPFIYVGIVAILLLIRLYWRVKKFRKKMS